MRKIVFYISDVGWGHATREIALIKEAVRRGFKVWIRNRSAAQLFLKELKGELDREKAFVGSPVLPSDPGWPSEYPVKKGDLVEILRLWLERLDRWIEGEKSFLLSVKPDLIVSDVVAQVTELSELLSVPAVFVTNLNWFDEYSHILGKSDEVYVFKNFYEKASHVFLLPFESENKAFRKKERAPLLVRRFDPERVREIRRSLLAEFRPELVAVFTLGGFYRHRTTFEAVRRAMADAAKKARILWIVPDYVEKMEGLYVKATRPDFHNYIAASDFVLAKCGYGVISEAVNAGIFGVYLYRPEVLEDSLVSEELVLSGWAARFPMGEDFEIPLEQIFSASKSPLSKRLLGDGAAYIMDRITEIFF